MINSQNPTARKAGLVIQEMPDEVLVYDLNTNKAHCLNQTAAFIWKSCNGENSIAEIKSLFEKKFGGIVTEDFIWLAIDQLNKDELLKEKVTLKFDGISRREVIKKVGLTSMIALPIVASLAVPNSALASSTCTARGACQESTDCDAGLPGCNCNGPFTCTEGGAACPTLGAVCGPTNSGICEGTCS